MIWLNICLPWKITKISFTPFYFHTQIRQELPKTGVWFLLCSVYIFRVSVTFLRVNLRMLSGGSFLCTVSVYMERPLFWANFYENKLTVRRLHRLSCGLRSMLPEFSHQNLRADRFGGPTVPGGPQRSPVCEPRSITMRWLRLTIQISARRRCCGICASEKTAKVPLRISFFFLFLWKLWIRNNMFFLNYFYYS